MILCISLREKNHLSIMTLRKYFTLPPLKWWYWPLWRVRGFHQHLLLVLHYNQKWSYTVSNDLHTKNINLYILWIEVELLINFTGDRQRKVMQTELMSTYIDTATSLCMPMTDGLLINRFKIAMFLLNSWLVNKSMIRKINIRYVYWINMYVI